MEERGLVTRKRDVNDRRVWRVSLTAKGRELYASLPDIGEAIRKKITQDIDKEELKTFNAVLDALIVNAKNMVDDA